MKVSRFNVIKASGEREPFSEKKFRRSVRRSGIPKNLENQLVNYIYNQLYDGIPTHEVYQLASKYLGKSPHPYIKAVYSLKQSIMQLGPGGFPFEKYIASVLKQHGYKIQTNLILSGKCVEHEIDVVAQKEDKRYMIECKFHNRPGARSDIKVALYVQARYEDLVGNKSINQDKEKFTQTWLVTNTKTTTEAIKYANCTGMQIIGWNYPQKGNLQDLVEEKNLYPITSLSSLTQDQKNQILNQGVVLCIDLLTDEGNILKKIGIRKSQQDIITSEIKAVCNSKTRQ